MKINNHKMSREQRKCYRRTDVFQEKFDPQAVSARAILTVFGRFMHIGHSEKEPFGLEARSVADRPPDS